jgi:hypothetical protein
MFTILGVWDSITHLPIYNVSVETRGFATVSNLGGGRFQIDGLPQSKIRISTPDHIPLFRSVSSGGVSEGIQLRPINALPRPSHAGYRLTWGDFDSPLPDWDRTLRSSVPVHPLFTDFTSFNLITLPGIWWKALKIFDRSGRLLQDLQSQEGTLVRGTASLFRIGTLSGATLVFSKAKFLGNPTDMYEVALDSAALARIRGYHWTFQWMEQ